MENQRAVEQNLNNIRLQLIALVAEIRKMMLDEDPNEEFIEGAVKFLEQSTDGLDKLHELMYGSPTTT